MQKNKNKKIKKQRVLFLENKEDLKKKNYNLFIGT